MTVVHDYLRRDQAKGHIDPYGNVLVACRFDEGLHRQIFILAKSTNTSFAEQVRRLVRDGIKVRNSAS